MTPRTEMTVPRNLEVLVTSVATDLMAVTAATSVEVSERVLGDLVSYFGVDGGSLWHNDHCIHASELVAEWPPREAATVAEVPLRSGDVTTGVLRFVKFSEHVWQRNELNALTAIASLFSQVQARIAAEERLRYLADHDDLTGLHNRRSLLGHLAGRLAKGRPGPVAVLFFDLDRLKAVNDYLGHIAGDWFIRILAERLQHGDEEKFIARLGGDEFVVVPAGSMTADTAETLAHTMQAVLRQRVSIDGEMLTRTISIGVAVGVPGRDTTSDLLSRAGQALLSAKNAGGNSISVFTERMSQEIALRNDIELHLQNVIDSGALVLHYLPEVDIRTGEILATEALVRWQHPTRGLLFPHQFIEVAESINLAGELGRWVLRNACAEFARWRSIGVADSIVLGVNVSPVQLVTDGFAESVAEVMADFGLERGSVCLEFTESVVVQDIDTTRVTLAGLKDAGVQVAIDDFGTGYSVLSLLKSLPVDTLKIDKSFVQDLGCNAGDLAIVRAIIALADAFGLELVAEGVETEAGAQTLLRHGCHRAQGFLLSRPVPGAQMERLLAEGRVPVHFS